MSDKIKSSRARARAAGDPKKRDWASWFENHVEVISCDGNKEKEEKIKQVLKDSMAEKQTGG
jgi:hypothetical protein|tara:strand:+ start:658 stop:843 length:186 start_codon:yes stop_codon:yes gene_type:complete